MNDLGDQLILKTKECELANRRLQKLLQEREHCLQLAACIRKGLLPRELPRVHPALFTVHHRPRTRVGGDCYGVFPVGNRHVGFFLADVVGQGVSAGLITAYLAALLREAASQNSPDFPDASAPLQKLNKLILEFDSTELPFVCLAWAYLHRDTGRLVLARAGLPCPIFIPHRGEPVLLQIPGTMLGVFETPIPVHEFALNPGDRLLFFTDGFRSMEQADDGGAERLLPAVAGTRELPMAELVERLGRDLAAGQVSDDDLTILGLEMTSALP